MQTSLLNKKTVLVVGAGSGLGQKIALDFAQLGAHTILAGRDSTKLENTANLISQMGMTTHILAVDICQESDVTRMLQAVHKISPALDIAVNCAGVVRPGTIDEMSRENFRLMLETNLWGVWLCMKYQLAQMKQQKHGTIINISANIGAHTIRPGMGGYAATKAALTVLTKTAALEAVEFNVRVHSISPGPLDTPLSYRSGEDKAARDERLRNTNPSKRVGELEEVSRVTQWLCISPTYLVGQDIVIDGGASI